MPVTPGFPPRSCDPGRRFSVGRTATGDKHRAIGEQDGDMTSARRGRSGQRIFLSDRQPDRNLHCRRVI